MEICSLWRKAGSRTSRRGRGRRKVSWSGPGKANTVGAEGKAGQKGFWRSETEDILRKFRLVLK